MKILLLLIFTLSSFYCFSQDTLKLEPSIHYSKQEEKELTRKGFHGSYGKEIIVFTKNYKRVECCYYVDSIDRKCIGTDYKIINDSILLVGNINDEQNQDKWNVKQLENKNYFLYKINDGVVDFGEFQSLFPLKPTKPIFTTTLDRLDTLWKTSFDLNCDLFLNLRTAEFYKNKISGKVYEYDKIDVPPTQLNGEPLKNISIKNVIPCLSEPASIDVSTVAIIVTKEGEIKNIQQAIGTLSEGCPFTLQEIIKEIKSWGKVNSAIKKGKKVNVRWFISINNLDRDYLHPVNEDNPKNRKKFIKRNKLVWKRN